MLYNKKTKGLVVQNYDIFNSSAMEILQTHDI